MFTRVVYVCIAGGEENSHRHTDLLFQGFFRLLPSPESYDQQTEFVTSMDVIIKVQKFKTAGLFCYRSLSPGKYCPGWTHGWMGFFGCCSHKIMWQCHDKSRLGLNLTDWARHGSANTPPYSTGGSLHLYVTALPYIKGTRIHCHTASPPAKKDGLCLLNEDVHSCWVVFRSCLKSIIDFLLVTGQLVPEQRYFCTFQTLVNQKGHLADISGRPIHTKRKHLQHCTIHYMGMGQLQASKT
ncbi:uncharacterized protein [Engystomops pustulosus]|uniref:uncharacterized protein isoform X2 n=1 Tax=Engystomops pustulosus TaxID=76066 RepID=UPI003AFB6266